MSNCKLVALDLDGTLTNSEKIIPKQNFDALMRLQRKGVKIVLASGRPKYGIMKLARQLELARYNGYILAYNGAVVIDCATDEIISSVDLPRQMLPALCSAAKELGVSILTYDAPRDLILTETRGDRWIEHEAWLNNQMQISYVADLNAAAPEHLPKCLMVADPDYLSGVEPIVRERFPQLDVYKSSPFFLEIVTKGIDKANVLADLVGRLGLSADNVAAFGDGHNDIGMVRYAGLGVAMANGCDEIKQVADFVSTTNDECGVAYAIEKFGL
ncbi:MAG: HAD family phosphatase [Bacteroidales bacterium]|nr:HAD family phosphatase [Bacteroidales bacterium]